MAIKIGINGFGRIGRLIFRLAIDRDDVEFVAMNGPRLTPEYVEYLLKYDTVHGRFKGDIQITDHSIIVNGKETLIYNCHEPREIPWGELGAEYIIESSGKFTTMEGSYLSWLTPITNMGASSEGAVMMTLRAPALM